MSVNNRVATAVLSITMMFAANAFAGDGPVAVKPAAAKPAAEKPVSKHVAAPKKTESAESIYARCVREKTVVAKTFCDSNPNACDAEKKGIKDECEDTVHHKRHTSEVNATGSH